MLEFHSGGWYVINFEDNEEQRSKNVDRRVSILSGKNVLAVGATNDHGEKWGRFKDCGKTKICRLRASIQVIVLDDHPRQEDCLAGISDMSSSKGRPCDRFVRVPPYWISEENGSQGKMSTVIN